MTRRRLSRAMALTLFCALALGGIPGRSGAARPGVAPLDGLRLSFHPYAGKGHEDMPVEVLKFDVNVHSSHMWVREWRLKNRSGKDIVKIRPALFVYSEREPEILLLRHQILPYYGVGLDPGEEWPQGPCSASGYYCPSAFGMRSAGELLKPLAKSGGPEGSYRIALGIDKVWFADGAVWEFEAAEGK